MSRLFITILNMSLTGSYVIVLVMVARLLLKKAPKVISYALWGVVACRLLLPFSFASALSLLPRNVSTAPIAHDIIYQQVPRTESGVETIDRLLSGSLPVPAVQASANPLQIYIEIAAYLWAFGVVLLFMYSMVSFFMLKGQLEDARPVGQNVFEASGLKTPFVLGIIKPAIYLPSELSSAQRNYVLLHERAHIRRADHIFKLLAFAVVCVHWFNPLVWMAFGLMSEDMELSCDEKVLKEVEANIARPYAASLLALASGRQMANGGPLAFGEGKVQGRIRNILDYKKPGLWTALVSVLALIVISIALLSNPAPVDQDLSMLDIKNLARVAQQKVVLFVSQAPGKDRGFNVSAQAVAQYLDDVRWTVREMDFPLELAADLQIEWGEDQELRFYASEPRLAMVRMNERWRYYTIGSNDYERIISIVETQTSPQSTLQASSEDLWKGRTKYIGDSSAVGRLIGLLAVPKDLSFGHFELHTAARPYAVHIVYLAPDGWLKHYDETKQYLTDIFSRNSLLLLALIDNADQIRVSISDGDGNKELIYQRDWADATVGTDIRTYAEHHEKLQRLLDLNLPAVDSSQNESLTQLGFDIEHSLNIIMSSPRASSNPEDYIATHRHEYENVLKYGGEDALQYMLAQFKAGNGDGLRGQIMMRLCQELLGIRNNVQDQTLSPKQWYKSLHIRQETRLPDYIYDGSDKTERLVYETELARASADDDRGGFVVVAPKIFGSYEEDDLLKVFVTTYSARYRLYGDEMSEQSGAVIPAAITYRKDGHGEYILHKYEQARDGSEFGPSIKEYCTRPASGKSIGGLADIIIRHYRDYDDLIALMNDNLSEHLNRHDIGPVSLVNASGEVRLLLNSRDGQDNNP